MVTLTAFLFAEKILPGKKFAQPRRAALKKCFLLSATNLFFVLAIFVPVCRGRKFSAVSCRLFFRKFVDLIQKQAGGCWFGSTLFKPDASGATLCPMGSRRRRLNAVLQSLRR